MTYAGLGAFLFRLIGVLLIGAVFVAVLPPLATSAATASQTAMVGGITLLPAVILITASKPLGRILAAGLE